MSTSAPLAPATPPAQAVALDLLAGTERQRRRRSSIVTCVLAVVTVVVMAVNLSVGDFPLSLQQVGLALVGQGEDTTVLVLREFRGPRLVLGALVGIALGLAGALFQSVLRNPLASPDIIGITQGASVGAVTALLLLGLGGIWVSAAALAGAGIVAAANLLLAWGAGINGQRFVLCGIGLAFMASSVLGYLLTRSDVRDAQSALVWLSGSVASAEWGGIARLAVAMLVLVPLALALSAPLRMLSLGEDTAQALGLAAQRTRVAAILVGVALAGVATAAAGPVAFVALAAAPIARNLVGDGRAALVPTAMVGLTLVTASDFTAQHLLPDRQVPVGLVTGVVGGVYLIWLLATNRPRPGGR